MKKKYQNSDVTTVFIKNEVTKEEAREQINKEDYLLTVRNEESYDINNLSNIEGKTYYRSVKEMQGKSADLSQQESKDMKNEDVKSFFEKDNQSLKNMSDKDILKYYYPLIESSIEEMDDNNSKVKFYKDLFEILKMHDSKASSYWGRLKILNYLKEKGFEKKDWKYELSNKIEFWKIFYERESLFFKLNAGIGFIASLISLFYITDYNKFLGQVFNGNIIGVIILSAIIIIPFLFLNVFWDYENYYSYEKKINEYINKLKEKYNLVEKESINVIEMLYYANKTNNEDENKKLLRKIYNNYEFKNIGEHNKSFELIRQIHIDFKQILYLKVNKILK